MAALVTRPVEEFEEALRFVRWGMNDCQISRLTGLPPTTVRGWRSKTQEDATWMPGRTFRASDCPICGEGDLNAAAYSYLLGMYLGDGHLIHMPRTMKLNIALDSKYPGIIRECCWAIAQQRLPEMMKVGIQDYGGWVVVTGHWKHWPCLFPQHGKGMKHLRKIELRAWQNKVVTTYPREFIRGLIHSDGCRFTNPVRRKRKNGSVKHYEYPRYMFTNKSEDIRNIFCDACDLLGIEWKQASVRNISVARRDSVAKLDEFVGPKR